MRKLLTGLECVECEASCEYFERGWRAYRVPEPIADLVVLCPVCAEREAGEDEYPLD